MYIVSVVVMVSERFGMHVKAFWAVDLDRTVHFFALHEYQEIRMSGESKP